MQARESITSIVSEILKSPELASGSHSIRHLKEDIETSSGLVYLFETGGLRTIQRELLVLFPHSPTEEEFTVVSSLARQHKVATKPICVVINEVPIVTHTSDRRPDFDIFNPSGFYNRLVGVPDHFRSMLRTVARPQRPNEFEAIFQERQMRVQTTGQDVTSPMPLEAHLLEWLSARNRVRPILLLGERGTGKTWQLLRFAEAAYTLNREAPWHNALAFFVRLNDLVNMVGESSAATPVLLHYLLAKYADVRFPFGGAGFLGALLRHGHCVVCLDGFDEMDVLPSDSEVRARLTSLLLLLSNSTRFILSCRPGHFESMASMFSSKAWGATSIEETFDIIELAPFDRVSKLNCIKATGQPARNKALLERISGLMGEAGAPLEQAISICAQHPGFLAHMLENATSENTTASHLIESGIEHVFVRYNVDYARTAKSYFTPEGERVDLSVSRRMDLLSDVAWYMADHQLDHIDLANLPPGIKKWYRIDDDVLERDLRSQTVFELLPEATENESHVELSYVEGEILNFPDALDENADAGSGRRSLARFTLRADEDIQADVGASSVCGAYFLARSIKARLLGTSPFGELADDVRFRALGRVKLSPQTAGILRELLDEIGSDYRKRLGIYGWRMIRTMAAKQKCRIYCPWLRHLATNLAAIEALSPKAATAVDPWTAGTEQIVSAPHQLGDYELAVIPAPDKDTDQSPFLLGIHEVTNEQYLRFLRHHPHGTVFDTAIQGQEWCVKRVTIAGSRNKIPPSPNAPLTNEYHLFFWMPVDHYSQQGSHKRVGTDIPTFLPPKRTLAQPVTYVSWYASAAYCDWVSVMQGFPRQYRRSLDLALGREVDVACAHPQTHGFRLPTKDEWLWAARGGYDDVDRPWDLFPYHLPRDLRETDEHTTSIVNPAAWENYKRAQEIMREVLLNSGKALTDVTHDEADNFGVCGLMGNVREWCDDKVEGPTIAESAHSDRWILGATGYLGDSSFSFDYCTPLYPRNTNPDVGFRLARSLSGEELAMLRQREAEIAALPESPNS